MSGTGPCQRIDTDDLRDFAQRVRSLLKDFEDGAGGRKTHGRTGLPCTAFGSFVEATAMSTSYNEIRDALRDILEDLEKAIDDAQRKADGTADDFERNDTHTAATLQGRDADGPSTPHRPPSAPPPTDVTAGWK